MESSVRPAAAVTVVAIALAAVTGCGGVRMFELPAGISYPSITQDTEAAGVRTVSHSFRFEGRERNIAVDVGEPLYQGARAAPKHVVRVRGADTGDWIDEYYAAFVWDAEQDPLFTGLITGLRGIRDSDGLDSDRYAELLIAFVQSLEYRTDSVELEPKFPVETVVERAGDCDDKTLLLAGLLAREGYDVAIMLFEAEQHVALGIRTSGPDYRATGYAFVETTRPGFVGMAPDVLAGGITLQTMPRLVPVGEGTAVYGSGHEVAEILALLDAADGRVAELAASVSRADADIASTRARVDAEHARLEALRTQGRLAEHEAGVAAYNRLVSALNTAVAARNAHADEHNRWAGIQASVLEAADNRPAAVRAVRSFRP